MTKRIRWVRTSSAGTTNAVAETIAQVKEPDTEVEVVQLSIPESLGHVEYRAYEAMTYREIVRLAHEGGKLGFDAMIIGCYYDPALKEAREVSGAMIVLGPCQATVQLATTLANRFSVIVGRQKWVEQMKGNIRDYGQEHALASMRPIELGVPSLHADHGLTERRIVEEARRAVEDDHAEAIILGCTAKYGFHEQVQREVGVPVIDAVCAPFKLAEHMAGLKQKLGWTPSRLWSCESPPEAEMQRFGLFKAPDKPNPRVVVPAKAAAE